MKTGIRFIAAIALLACMIFPSTKGQSYHPNRLHNNEPLIAKTLFDELGVGEDGENINGPSLIRIPDWIPLEDRVDSSAVYYLYFAHHQGDYLRLAWSDNLLGPYHLYKTGTGFEIGNRGVLDLGSDDKIKLDNGITVHKHIASPDVHVDDSNQQIIMYFHGPTIEPGGQRTFVALSPDGLSFQDSILPVVLGGSCFMVFEYKDTLYSVDNRADIYKGGPADDPWRVPPDHDYMDMLWTQNPVDPFQVDLDQDPALVGKDIQIRHVGVHVEEDTLWVFYSRIGDSPERIMLSYIRLDDREFDDWDPSYPPLEILSPEYQWEGSHLSIKPSDGGSSKEHVHQLRDPDVFEDIDGSLYMLYTGAGENGIGIASLERTYGNPLHSAQIKSPQIISELSVTRNPNAEAISFRINTAENSTFEIRIYNLTGTLVDIVKGQSLPDGYALAEWNPRNLKQGIYIANLITNYHSVSVKFRYW